MTAKLFLIRNKNIFLSLFAASIALACIFYIFRVFQWNEIWQIFQKANFLLFLLGSITTLLGYWLLRTARWFVLLRNEQLQISFFKLYLYIAITSGLSTVTPFQSGEAVKVEILRKYGGERLSGYASFFIEKIFDLLAIILLAFISLFAGFDFGIQRIYFYGFAAVLGSVFLIVIASIFLVPSDKLNSLRNLIKEKRNQKRILLTTFLLTLASWLVVVYGWKVTLQSVFIEVDFIQAIALVSITTLLMMLSFVPGGIGVSEVSISTLLGKMGLSISEAQTGALAVRAYALMILILALVHWLFIKLFYRTKES